MAIVGPILIAVGLSYITSAAAGDSRLTAIKQWSAKEKAWTGGAQKQMARMTYSVCATTSLHSPSGGNKRPMNLQTTGEVLSDLGRDDGDKKAAYTSWTPAYFTASVTPTWSPNYNTRTLTLVVTSSGATVGTVRLTAGQLCKKKTYSKSDLSNCHDICNNNGRRRLKSRRSRRSNHDSCTTCSSACNSKGGYWQQGNGQGIVGQCFTAQAIKSISVLVAAGGKTLLSPPGFPCGTAGTCSSSDGMSGAMYGTVVASKTCTLPSTLPVTLRSVQSPYVQAAKITSYSMSFGMTRGEKVTTGIYLILFGLALTAVPVGLCLCCKEMFKKNRQTGMAGPMMGATPYASDGMQQQQQAQYMPQQQMPGQPQMVQQQQMPYGQPHMQMPYGQQPQMMAQQGIPMAQGQAMPNAQGMAMPIGQPMPGQSGQKNVQTM